MSRELKEIKKLLSIDWANPSIPTIPTIAVKLMELLNSKDVSSKEVAELICQDPALTVKVLRAVNSAFYALNTEVTNIRHATVLLGASEVLKIAITSVLAERFLDVPASAKASAMKLWTHSVAVAVLSQDFDIEGVEEPDLYTLGLLHDIGWLLILSQIPDLYTELSKESEITFDELEKSWGVNHRAWGAKLSEIWELPEPFQVVSLKHHDPLDIVSPPDYLLFITLANHLAHKIGFAPLACDLESMDPWLLEKMRLDEEAYLEIEKAAFQEKEKIGAIVNQLIH